MRDSTAGNESRPKSDPTAYDPELEAELRHLAPLTLAERISVDRARSSRGNPVARARVLSIDMIAPGSGGPVPLRVHAPANAAAPLPVVLWFHGGAFCIGSALDDDFFCALLAERTSARVVSVDYRLAPEHPYPAAIEDAYHATQWAAKELAHGQRLAVAGISAGAGLAAGVALMARDGETPALCFQLLSQPFIDDRCSSESMHEHQDAPVFSAADARHGWALYLQGMTDVSPYAAPARADDLAGLPPAFVLAAGLDPLRDEALTYARRLAASGVHTEVREVAGVPHGFSAVAPRSTVARAAFADYVRVLRAALHEESISTLS